MTAYRPVFDEAAAVFIAALSKRRQKVAVRLARQLAEHPFVRSDYALPDESGRLIDHLLLEDFVFSYWLDHAEHELRITEIEDAS